MDDITTRFIDVYYQLLKERKIVDQKDFSRKIGVSSSMITEIIKGRSNVGLKAIQNTVISFNVDSNWLFTGQGETMLNSVKEEKKESTQVADQSPDQSQLMQLIREKDERIMKQAQEIWELKAELQTIKKGNPNIVYGNVKP
jgi:transcriptional regulator with XRE-family HTH domain